MPVRLIVAIIKNEIIRKYESIEDKFRESCIAELTEELIRTYSTE